MRIRTQLISLLLSIVILAPAVHAEMLPVRKLRVGQPPFEVLEEMTRHNDQVVTSIREGMPQPVFPAPHITWLADSDARQQPDQLYPDFAEKVYQVRSPGGLFAPAASSIDYGVNELHTPVLLITAATNGARPRRSSGPEANAAAWADLPEKYAAQPAVKDRALQPVQPTAAGPFLASAEQNVDIQVAAAASRYRKRIDNGRLVVVGAVLDLADRYRLGASRLVIININGETDPARLRTMSHAVRLEPRLVDMVGRRLSGKAEPTAGPPAKAVKKTGKGKKQKGNAPAKPSAKAGKATAAKPGGKGKATPPPEPEEEENRSGPAYEFKY
ncbi:MAG: hypothetical protein ACOY3Z_03695 [Thermodesulfobacteriota bacterium]